METLQGQNLRTKRLNMLLNVIAGTGRYKADKLVADFSVMTGLQRSRVVEYIEILQTAGFLRTVGSFVELIDRPEKEEVVQP